MVKKVISIMLTVMLLAINTMTFPSQQTVKAEETRPIVKVGDKYYYADIVTDEPTSTAPVYSGSADVDSDEYKAANAKGMFKTPGGDGRVWTDKSVAVAADNKSFDVTLSTVGQTYTSITSTISQTRADVLLLLDITQSMDTSDIGGARRYTAMTNAANQAIDIIMRANPYNRIEVATFGNDTEDNWENNKVLLPLDSYTAGSDGKYINSSTSTTNNFKLTSSSGLKDGEGKTYAVKTVNATSGFGTLTQYSVYQAINHMINEITAEGSTATTKTIPYVLLLTDGNATHWYPGSSVQNVEVSKIIRPDSYTGSSKWDATPSGAAATILTAAYWKDQLSNKYYVYNNATTAEEKAGVETRFFSIALSNDVNGEFNALVAPKLLLSKYPEDGSLWDENADTRTIKDNLQITKTQAKNVADKINAYATGDLADYSTSGDKYIYTTDTYYYKARTVQQLDQAFRDLAENVASETGMVLNPVEETTTGSLFGGVTITDTLGTGMHLTDADILTATVGNSKTITLTKQTSPQEGYTKEYKSDPVNGKTMFLLVDELDGIETITWEVPAGMLPLFTKNESGAYVDADPIRLTYNVSIDSDMATSINGMTSEQMASLNLYSNKFSSKKIKTTDTSTIGDAVGIYVPKPDNPHFFSIGEDGTNNGTHPRFLESDGTTKKTINVDKVSPEGNTGGNTGTATYAGVASFPNGEGHNIMENYLGNNGRLALEPVDPIDIPVMKTWNDSGSGRPSSITVQLYKTVNGTTSEAGDPVTIVPDPTTGAWSHTFAGLSPYEEIDSVIYPVTYSVKEIDTSKNPAVPVDDGGKIGSYGVSYGTAENGTLTITNTELTSVPVQKIWKDDGTDSGRPAVTVQLYADGSPVEGKTEALTDGYAYTFTDLPKYSASGNAIAYTVRELGADGNPVAEGGKTGSYIASYSAADDGKLTITNTLVTSLPVTKTWADGGNAGSTRPESIRVQLYRTANSETAKVGDPVEIAPDKTTGAWSYTFESLPAYVEIGTDIYPATYSAREVDASGDPIADGVRYGSYVVSYDPGNGGAIANALVVDVPVEKIWDDNNNQDGRRPEAVWVELYADGTAVAGSRQKLDSSNEFKHKYQSLPAYNGDAAIVYTVAELTGESGSAIAEGGKYNDDYTVSYGTVDGAATLTITNKHVPDVTEVTVKKIWDDASDQDGYRPASVTFQLWKTVGSESAKVEGKTVAMSTSTEGVTADASGNAYTYTFKDLPANEAGKPIAYFIKELDSDGAEIAVSGGDYDDNYAAAYSGSNLIVTNSHTPETVNVEGTKTWSDADYIGKTGYARPSITINILDGENIVDTITVTPPAQDTGTWSWKTTKPLPKRRNGSEIQYTVVEVTPEGFAPVVSGYSIVNTPKRDENDKETPVKLTVRKLVTGTEAGLNGATFTLIDADKNESDYTTAVDGTATIEFTKTGTYTLKEKSAPEGYDIDPNEYTIVVDRSLVSVSLNENKTAWQWLYELLFSEETKSISIFDESASTLTIHDRAIVDIPVEKIWDDLNDAARIRPAEISVSLYADGVLVESVMIDGELSADGILVLSKENSWKGTYEDLDRYTEDGEEIVYTIRETVPEKYTATYSGSAKEGFRVTNYFRPIPPVPYIPPVTGDR